jgi:hypothetical protein
MQLTCINLQNLTSLSKFDFELLSAVIKLWQETYGEILQAAGESLQFDDFFFAKVAMVLHEGESLLGFCLLNSRHLGLPGVRQSSYFKSLPEEILNELVDRREKMFSIEWVTVHPEHRAKFRKVQLADLLMGVSFRVFHESGHTTAIGFSRTDVGADRIAMNFGGRGFATIILHGIPCRVMLGRKEWIGAHKFGVVEKAIEEIWQARRVVFADMVYCANSNAEFRLRGKSDAA